MGKAQHVYNIAGYARSITRLENYSKTIFLINMGDKILGFRKGYVIDTASLEMGTGSNNLRYIGGNKLIHVTDIKVEVYNFTIN